ncbi:MAG TPA: ion channel [Actinomycetes bacterium]|jgi:voltage-gated potassium channel Kch|nr:ion channel [Actinomycetes bacterium]
MSRLLRAVLHDQDSYVLLLVLLLVEYFALMVIPQDRWSRVVSAVMVAGTLLLGLRTSGVGRRTLRAASIASAVGAVAVIVPSLASRPVLVGQAYAVLGVLLAMTPPAVLRRVLHHQTVTTETIAGAVCVYVLLGLVFAFLYLAIGSFAPNAFSQPTGSEPKGSATYLYFSFISLTTVGFGDIVPVGKVARALVVLEALLGQIFLVTTVARLVALFSAQGPRPPRLRR